MAGLSPFAATDPTSTDRVISSPCPTQLEKEPGVAEGDFRSEAVTRLPSNCMLTMATT